MKPEAIGPLTQGDELYNQAVSSAKDQSQLTDVIASWSWLIPDAWAAIQDDRFNWDEWKKWQRRKKKATSLNQHEKQIYSVISMPRNMIQISMTAIQFHAPWGVAYSRLKEFGALEFKK